MNGLTNLKIVTKIMMLAGFMLTLTCGIAYIGYKGAYDINTDSDDQAVSTREVSMNLELLSLALIMPMSSS